MATWLLSLAMVSLSWTNSQHTAYSQLNNSLCILCSSVNTNGFPNLHYTRCLRFRYRKALLKNSYNSAEVPFNISRKNNASRGYPFLGQNFTSNLPNLSTTMFRTLRQDSLRLQSYKIDSGFSRKNHSLTIVD